MTHAVQQVADKPKLDERDERARKAVKAFRTMQPMLSSFARILTRNPKVRVEMSETSNGHTDGTKIYFRPPIALGDMRAHERRLCDKRGENKQQMCEACGIREQVLGTIFHEISHIVCDSFQPVTERDIEIAIDAAVKAHGGKYAKKLRQKMEAEVQYGYNNIGQYVSKYMPIVVNCLEDARIEWASADARPGTRSMYVAGAHRVFVEGFEGVDPEDGKTKTFRWNEAPLDSQMSIALYVKAGEYGDYSTWFSPEVVDAVNDQAVSDLCERVRTARKVADVWHLAFPILARLRELGFFRDDYSPEEEEEPQPEEEPGEESGSNGDDSEESEPDDDADGDEGGDSESDPADADGDDDSSEADDQPGDSDDSASEGDGDESGEGDAEAEPGDEDGTDGPEEAGNTAGSEGAEVDDDSSMDQGESGSDEDGADADGEPSDTGEAGEGQSSDSSGTGESEPTDGSDSSEVTGPFESRGRHGTEVGDDDETTDDNAPAEGSSEGEAPSDDLGTGQPGSSTDSRNGDVDGTGIDERNDAGLPEEPVAGDSLGDDGDLDWSDGDVECREHDGQSSGGASSGNASLDDNEDHSDPSERVDGDLEDNGSLSSSDQDGDGDPVDTGADNGTGGVEATISDRKPSPPSGTPEQAEIAVLKFLGHDKPDSAEIIEDDNAVGKAIIQGIYFETPSRNIRGVREHFYGKPNTDARTGYNFSTAWDRDSPYGYGRSDRTGRDGHFDPAESIMGPALLKTRRAFDDNARGGVERNLKSGKVRTSVLGKRAPQGDPRLFVRKRLPGKRDYFVVIMMDISGSTVGQNILIMKQAVMAQATLLHRAGIKFAIYAHSGASHEADSSSWMDETDLEVYVIKSSNDPWGKDTQLALVDIGPDAINLDGHALEYGRKRVEESGATDQIILYYSDGKMPAANHDEELQVLQREIRYCRNHNITLLGVGIRTDSPAKHGLETVQLDDVSETGKVIDQLKKYLVRKR